LVNTTELQVNTSDADVGPIHDISDSRQNFSSSYAVNRLDAASTKVVGKQILEDSPASDGATTQATSSPDSAQEKQTSVDQTEQLMNNVALDEVPLESISIYDLGNEFLLSSSTSSQVPEEFQAGGPINMIVEGTEGISTSPVSMTPTSADSGETVQVSGTLSEDVGAGILGNRRIASFTLPYDLSSGFYRRLLCRSTDRGQCPWDQEWKFDIQES